MLDIRSSSFRLYCRVRLGKVRHGLTGLRFVWPGWIGFGQAETGFALLGLVWLDQTCSGLVRPSEGRLHIIVASIRTHIHLNHIRLFAWVHHL